VSDATKPPQPPEPPDAGGDKDRNIVPFPSQPGQKAKQLAESLRGMQEKAGLPPADVVATDAPTVFLGLPDDDLAARIAELLQASDGRWGLFRYNDEIGTVDFERSGLRSMDGLRFRSWLPRARGCILWEKKKREKDEDGTVLSEQLIKASMTKDQAAMVLASDDMRLKLPCIERFHGVRMPVYDGDRRVKLLDEGYDAATKVFTLPGVEYDTDMEFQDGVEHFYYLFRHFGWRNERRDFAIHLSAILTMYCRGLFKGKAPLYIYNANMEGSGKTTLSHYIGWLIYGTRKITPLVEGKEDKLQELLNTLALHGVPYINFDNVNWGNHEINSALLEAWVTGKQWDMRKLGGNDLRSPELVGVTLMTGNRLKLHADLARRALIVDLLSHQAGSERELPKGVTLIDDDYFDDVEHRKQGLAAAWAIVREWSKQGAKPFQGKLLDSFTGWSRIVPAMVQMSGAHFGKVWDVFQKSENEDLGDKVGGEFKQLAEICLAQYGRDEHGEMRKAFEVTVAQMAGVARLNAIATGALYPEIDIESVMQTEDMKGGWRYVEAKGSSQFFDPPDKDDNERRRQASEWMSPKSRSAFGNAVKARLHEKYFRGPDGELYEFTHRIKTTPAKYLVTRVQRRA
jgi:hypothetical protein